MKPVKGPNGLLYVPKQSKVSIPGTGNSDTGHVIVDREDFTQSHMDTIIDFWKKLGGNFNIDKALLSTFDVTTVKDEETSSGGNGNDGKSLEKMNITELKQVASRLQIIFDEAIKKGDLYDLIKAKMDADKSPLK